MCMYTAANTEETLQVDGDELLRRKCDRLHVVMPVSFVNTSFRTSTFLPCDRKVHRSTLGGYLEFRQKFFAASVHDLQVS